MDLIDMRTSTAPPRSAPGGPSTPDSSTPGSSTPGPSTPGSSTPGSSTPGEASDERDHDTTPRSSAVTAGTAASIVVAVIAVASTTLEQQDSAEAAEFTSAASPTSVTPSEPLESLLDTDASEDDTEALAEAEERVDPTAPEGMAAPGDVAAPRHTATPGDLSASEMAEASRRPPDPDDPMEARLAEEPPILDTLVDAAERKDVDPELVVAVAWHESRWDQGAVSNAGALGVMQVLRPTAEAMAEKTGRSLDPRDPADNATAGSAYLARLLERYDDVDVALVAYNQGPSALDADGPYPAAEDFAEDVLETRERLHEVDW